MNARTSIAAFAVAAALSLTNATHTHAGFNFDRDFRNILGNSFNNNFGGNNRNFFRQADRGRLRGVAEGNHATLVLTDRSLLLADERQWRPHHERFTLDGGLQVQGWQDDRTASLTLLTGGRQLVVDGIADRPLAVELAQRIRARTGA